MGAREEIQKRIEKKRNEINSLEGQIGALRIQMKEVASYIQALEDTLKLLPREGVDSEPLGSDVNTLRTGSSAAKARELLQRAGRPMHITEILNALGKPLDATTRSGLSGSLSAYVREGKIFTRPAPNTFALIGIAESGKHARGQTGPPANFGVDEPIQEDFEDEVESQSRLAGSAP